MKPETKHESIVPEYWEAKLNEAIDTVNQHKSNSENFSSFIFVTDIHWEKNNKNAVMLANYLKQKIGIKRFIFGGDIIMGQLYINQSKRLVDDWLNHLKLLGSDGWYAVRGNHDNNGACLPKTPSDVWTDDEYYDNFLQYANNANKDGSKKLYNYTDDTHAKIRYYFLDTHSSGALPQDSSKINMVSYETQLEWLLQTVSELNNEWGIIIIQHRIFNLIPLKENVVLTKEMQALIPTVNDCDFPSFDNNGMVISPILKRKKGDGFPICDEFSTVLIPVLNRISADISAPDVIGVITGHAHFDAALKTRAGYSIICTTCDAGGSSSRKYDNYNPYRIPNTTIEQVLDIIQIDRTNRKLFLTRLGPGHNREFTY